MARVIGIFKGVEGGLIEVPKGTDGTITAQVLSTVDGAVRPLTGETVTFEVYDTADRRNAVIKTISTAITTALAGYVTATLTPAVLNFGPGSYYMFIKVVDAGALVHWSRKHTILKVT
jgi:hypothetical protein